MPADNLTRAEAEERAALISTESYDVVLDLTAGPDTFTADTTILFTAVDGSSTFLDAITDSVRSIELNGRAVDPAAAADGTRIALDGLAAHNVVRIVSDMAYTNTGEGLSLIHI